MPKISFRILLKMWVQWVVLREKYIVSPMLPTDLWFLVTILVPNKPKEHTAHKRSSENSTLLSIMSFNTVFLEKIFDVWMPSFFNHANFIIFPSNNVSKNGSIWNSVWNYIKQKELITLGTGKSMWYYVFALLKHGTRQILMCLCSIWTQVSFVFFKGTVFIV